MAFVTISVFEVHIISFAGCVQSKSRTSPTDREDMEIADGGKKGQWTTSFNLGSEGQNSFYQNRSFAGRAFRSQRLQSRYESFPLRF